MATLECGDVSPLFSASEPVPQQESGETSPHSKARAPRRGLTLIELLVLIVLAVGAIALLIPWLVARREQPRRAMCEKRQNDLSRILLEQEEEREDFPGYVNRLTANRLTGPAGRSIAASWVVELLPQLARKDLAEAWRGGRRPMAYLPALACPEDPAAHAEQRDGVLSYVVNCGRLPEPRAGTGIFFNHDVDSGAIHVSLADVVAHDGAETTLLLSENLQSGLWSDTALADLGMGWWNPPEECSRINRCRQAPHGTHELRYARPSSNHPGGVVVTFCDGHDQFMSEAVDYTIFQRLMAPDDKAAGLPVPEPFDRVPNGDRP